MKFFSTKLIVITALCAFMGAGSMFGMDTTSLAAEAAAKASPATAGSSAAAPAGASSSVPAAQSTGSSQSKSWSLSSAWNSICSIFSSKKSSSPIILSSDEAILVVQTICDVLKEKMPKTYNNKMDAITEGLNRDLAIEQNDFATLDIEVQDNADDRQINELKGKIYSDSITSETLRLSACSRKFFVQVLQASLRNGSDCVKIVMDKLDKKLKGKKRKEAVNLALTQLADVVVAPRAARDIAVAAAHVVASETLEVWNALASAWDYTNNGVWNSYIRYPVIYQYMYRPAKSLWNNKWAVLALVATAKIFYNRGFIAGGPSRVNNQSTPASIPASISTQSQLKEVRLP